MKFSFNIDLALIITVFTAFLFWCGYWYNFGYAEYFGVPISFFELSLSTTLVDGIVVAPDRFLTLLTAILVISFFAGYSRKDAEFIMGVIFTTVLFLLYLVRFKFYDQHKKLKYFPITSLQLTPYQVEYIFKKRKPRPLFCDCDAVKFSIKKLTKNKITYQQIANSAYGDSSQINGETTIFRIAIHYFVLLIFVYAFIAIFSAGQNLQAEGFKIAEHNHKTNFSTNIPKETNYTKFPAFIEKGQEKVSAYKLTNVCNKNSCFAVNSKRNVKLFEIKDIVIQNGPIKKAP